MQTESSDILCTESIENCLGTRLIGKKIIHLDSVDSTNNYLKALGFSGEESGTVVTAEEQTSGKGRLGRSWYAKGGECLMFSLLFRPCTPPDELSPITLISGLAVCTALRESLGIDCKIKWPNDIIVSNKKLCGILTELSTDKNGNIFSVIGIGINVSQTSFEPSIAHKATSLRLLTGKSFDKNSVLSAVLCCLKEALALNGRRLTEEALSKYGELCETLGREVIFSRDNRELHGKAVSVDRSGRLEVLTADGKAEFINSGEVTVQGIY